MRVAVRQEVGDAFRVAVYEVDPSLVRTSDDDLPFDVENAEVLVEYTLHGQKNSRRRLERLVTSYKAIDLTAPDGLSTLLEAASDVTENGVDSDDELEALLGSVKLDDTPPAVKSVKVKPKPKKKDKTPRGFRLTVTRPKWKGREYVVGEALKRVQVDRSAARWAAEGFETTVIELSRHGPAGKLKALWSIPGEPILCRVPGCEWVGDHLGPHLRAHSMVLKTYRKAFHYDGPSMVNRAKAAISKAHGRVRRSHELRLGAFMADIQGDVKVDVYRIAKKRGAGIFELELVSSSDPFADVGEATDWDAVEIVRKLRPIMRWAKRTMTEARTMCGLSEEK